MEFKRMNLKEFKDEGFLLEVNRQFFHPLGLALYVYYDREDLNNEKGIDPEVDEPIGLSVQDWRDDAEGCFFVEFTEEDKQKAANVEALRKSKEQGRLKLFGTVIQPIE